MNTRPPALALLLALAPAQALASQPRDLCDSVPGACTHTGPDAPALEASVCLDSTGLVWLEDDPCPAGAWPYRVTHGEILDPLTLEVAAYVPLGWACERPGLCEPGDGEGRPTTVQALCCEWGVCVPLTEVLCNSPDSLAVMCLEGASNEDGSIDCFEGDGF